MQGALQQLFQVQSLVFGASPRRPPHATGSDEQTPCLTWLITLQAPSCRALRLSPISWAVFIVRKPWTLLIEKPATTHYRLLRDSPELVSRAVGPVEARGRAARAPAEPARPPCALCPAAHWGVSCAPSRSTITESECPEETRGQEKTRGQRGSPETWGLLPEEHGAGPRGRVSGEGASPAPIFASLPGSTASLLPGVQASPCPHVEDMVAPTS